jgi:uncharacterized cupredoxin-like copper-binding protein
MVVFVGGVWLLAIPFSPAPILETGTVIPIYRAMGMVPEVGKTTISSDIGHDVFEVPEEDAKYLKLAMKAMGGMKMDGMKKEADHAEEKKDEDHAKEGMKMEGMKMKDMPGMKMEGMKKEAEEDHAKEAEEAEAGHGGGSVAEGLTVIAQGTTADIERELVEKGLTVDSTVEIDMKEWGFSNSMTMALPGQVIRLKVRNTGNLPHEFMIMNGAAMSAVNYRLTRPDWNLLEHEALSEVPFVMPGDSFEMVVQVHKSGMWMYMCMFPYHMQLGMMGMLMTPDMMGKMGGMNMGGMKM